MTVQHPEIITLSYDKIGGHAQHWQLIHPDAQHKINGWLAQCLDAPESPLGICSEQQLPQNIWLLQNRGQKIKIQQIVEAEQQQAKRLINAYPSFSSPHHVQATISRITHCPERQEAVLEINLASGASLYGFDTLYAINQHQYQQDTPYQVELSAWAYTLEKVAEQETMHIDDPAAIRHHRALNAILAANKGKTPANLQEQLAAWQPQSPEDELPLTLDISKMVAYLYGEHIGQEDEAWFQGDIIGKSSSHAFGQDFVVYDVALLREPDTDPVITQLLYAADKPQFEVGDYVRGNIWLQFTIQK